MRGRSSEPKFVGVKDKTRVLKPHQIKQTHLREPFAFAPLHASELQMSLATRRQARSALLAYDLASWATRYLRHPTRIELRYINGMILILEPVRTAGVPIRQRGCWTSIRQSECSGEFCESLLGSIGYSKAG